MRPPRPPYYAKAAHVKNSTGNQIHVSVKFGQRNFRGETKKSHNLADGETHQFTEEMRDMGTYKVSLPVHKVTITQEGKKTVVYEPKVQGVHEFVSLEVSLNAGALAVNAVC
jgi:hypothetical protein